ncbi:uncharacterized protein BDR25DRAFT_371526, partial [Lindgomyces ingoldianus]
LHDPQASLIGTCIRTCSPSSLHKITLKNVRFFNRLAMSSPKSVTIDGEHISDYEEDELEIVDAAGRFLIPSLIDNHVHVPNILGLENITSYSVTTLNMACRNNIQYQPLQGQEGLANFRSTGIPAVGPNSAHANSFNLSTDQLVVPDSDPVALVNWAFRNGSGYLKITAETNGLSRDMQNGLFNSAHDLRKQTTTHGADITAFP